LDPLSQGAIGACLSQSLSSKKNLLTIGIIGFLAGMSPDLDVLIKSDQDPLLFLEFHRQFTHSLVFIPIGGLIFASVFYSLFKRRISLSFKQVWFYASVGYGTHGILDSFTSYGTQLLWPFNNDRISWNNISIIDPLFTIPIIVLITLAAIKKSPFLARVSLIWAIFYLSLGWFQHQRAIEFANELIQQRGHNAIEISVKPSFGNLILWKIIYKTKDRFFVDAVNLGPKKQHFNGDSIDIFNLDNYELRDKLTALQKNDIERFKWFSQGFIAINPNNRNQILDIRYSNLPNEIGGLWGIELTPNSDNHVRFISNRETNKREFDKFFAMIFN